MKQVIMKRILLLLVFIPVLALAEPMHSPTWGFFMDLPEGYAYTDGDALNQFSFSGPEGLMFDVIVYNGHFSSLMELANDVNRRLSNRGEVDFFRYRNRQAAVFTLIFGDFLGWGIAVELDRHGNSNIQPMLLALSYGPSEKRHLELFHLSALDSVAPSAQDRLYPGLITEYSYPRGNAKSTPIAFAGLSAMIRENDAEASQDFIEREFKVLLAYLNTTYLQAATIRYYRSIYRDSFDRIEDALNVVARHYGGHTASSNVQRREFAQRVLTSIQNFSYERDLTGSDFLNLVSLVSEGSGSCDNRSLLYIMILARANVRGAMMLSHYYSHAMALLDLPGTGSRVGSHDVMWLVAETTDKIDIGLIAQEISDMQHWFAVVFD